MWSTLPFIFSRAELRADLVVAIQRAWRRHELLVPLYRQLAARAADEQRETMFLTIAELELAHQRRYRRALARLHAPLPPHGGLLDRLWLWLLPRCGLAVALRWAEWIEQRDTHLILELLLLLRIQRQPAGR